MKKLPIETIHPELQKLAGRMPQVTFGRNNLWLIRLLDHVIWIRKPPADIHIEHTFIPSPDPRQRIRLRIYRPNTPVSSAPALVWLHGGGYLVGKPEQDDVRCFQYVRELGIVVVSVDYRYAPEHPFPAALFDCYAALKWLSDHSGQLGVDANRIAIGGESAGGGLAAALVQYAVDQKEIRPVFQLLVYPMLDDRTAVRADLADRIFLAWNQASNRFAWESYLKKSSFTALPAYSVPSRRADLAGLPPAWIGVGTLDLFYDEDVAYGKRLQDCGVACEIVVVPGAFHGFELAGMHVPVVKDFRGSQIAAIQKFAY